MSRVESLAFLALHCEITAKIFENVILFDRKVSICGRSSIIVIRHRESMSHVAARRNAISSRRSRSTISL